MADAQFAHEYTNLLLEIAARATFVKDSLGLGAAIQRACNWVTQNPQECNVFERNGIALARAILFAIIVLNKVMAASEISNAFNGPILDPMLRGRTIDLYRRAVKFGTFPPGVLPNTDSFHTYRMDETLRVIRGVFGLGPHSIVYKAAQDTMVLAHLNAKEKADRAEEMAEKEVAAFLEERRQHAKEARDLHDFAQGGMDLSHFAHSARDEELAAQRLQRMSRDHRPAAAGGGGGGGGGAGLDATGASGRWITEGAYALFNGLPCYVDGIEKDGEHVWVRPLDDGQPSGKAIRTTKGRLTPLLEYAGRTRRGTKRKKLGLRAPSKATTALRPGHRPWGSIEQSKT